MCNLKEKMVRSRGIILENGQKSTADYYLLIDEIRLGDGSLLCENYGIKTILSTPPDREESAVIRGITPSCSKILWLINMAADNDVTPVSLEYIVEDYLAI